MKRGTAAKVILGKDTLMDVPAGIVHGTDVILGGKAGLLNDFGGLVLSNNLMLGKKVSRGTITTVTVRGVAPIILPDAIAGSLQAVKAFGGAEQRNIPEGYTQLEYIESSGTQYIDTGLNLTQDNTVEVEYNYYTESNIATSGRMFGARYTSSPRRSFSLGSNSGYASSATKTFAQFGNADRLATNNITIGQWGVYKMSADGFYIDGVLQGSFPATTFETPFTVKLFAFEQASSSSGTPTVGGGVGRCRRFKVYQGDTLVMDLIPAKNPTNDIGMYDLVSGQFFTNQGTGSFFAGPEAVPTPDAPMDIVSNNGVLKINNLFDINSVDNGHYWAANGTYSEASAARLSNTVPVKQGDVIAVTTKVSGSTLNIRYNFFDTQMNWLSQTVYAQSSGDAHTEYITAQQDGYFNFSGNYTGQGSVVLWDEVVIINQSNPIYTDGTVETINAHGANLLDLANCVDGYYYSPTGEYEPIASARLSNFIPVKAGVAYTVFVYGLKGSANVRTNLFDTQKNWLSQTVSGSILGQYIAISVTPTQDGYLAFSANFVTTGSCIDWSLSQVVQGSYTVATMPEYQPYYDGGTATAEMLLKVGDYQDEQEILSGAITRKVGIKVLDGTETGWVKLSGVNYMSLLKTAIPNMTSGTDATCLSNSFVQVPHASISLSEECFSVGASYVNFKKAGNPTTAQFKQWLTDQYTAGTPVIVLYPLATPTTESVARQTLQVTDGDNVLEIKQASLTGLELEATYKSLVQLTIQEVEDANLNNNVEVTIS